MTGVNKSVDSVDGKKGRTIIRQSEWWCNGWWNVIASGGREIPRAMVPRWFAGQRQD